ncbi:MAG: GNAT family N-acetyltransferase [Aggregatilineales bacterium]
MNLTLTPYARRHRNAVMALRFHSQRTHTHLDWHRAVNWLDRHEQRVYLVCEGERLIGFWGISEAMGGAAWVRLLAIHDRADATNTLSALWQTSQPYLYKQGIRRVFLLVSESWLEACLPEIGFEKYEMVVTMFRKQNETTLPDIAPHHIKVRDIYFDDLKHVLRIDNAAFPVPWQMSHDELYQSVRIASSTTLALQDNQIVGYQVSTRHQRHGHLARLAVDTTLQGRGIAKILLHHMIERTSRRGIRSISVNTQDTNMRSQHLYEQFGFQRNFYDLPVFSADVQEQV